MLVSKIKPLEVATTHGITYVCWATLRCFLRGVDSRRGIGSGLGSLAVLPVLLPT